MASAVGRIQNLVVKDREVESKTQSNGVGRRELGLSYISSVLYSVDTGTFICARL